ncbi:MAG: hypothetical protein RIR26_2685, partial [Pseudomonadota bacterium]
MPSQKSTVILNKNRNGRSTRTWLGCLLLATAATHGLVLTGCDSKAKVNWEDKERTGIQNKFGTIITDTELSVLYDKISASLTEEERPLLNSIVTTIMERNPSQAQKPATLRAVFNAIENLKSNADMRSKLPLSLAHLLKISETLDIAVQRFAESISAEAESERLQWLEKANSVASTVEKALPIKDHLESVSTKLDAVNFGRIVRLWDASGIEGENQERLLDALLTAANAGDSGELSLLLTQIENGTNRQDIFSVLKEMIFEDKNLSLFQKILNRVTPEIYPHLIFLIKIANDPATANDVLNALIESLRKAIPLNPSLVGQFISTTRSVAEGKDALVHLNQLTVSVDTLSGEGFYTSVGFSNKYMTDAEPLQCEVFGLGSEKTAFSFQWTTNGLSGGWTTPDSSLSKKNTTKSLVGDKVFCSVKILVDGIVATVPELESDLVTVKAAPPRFNSGDPPSDQLIAISQGEQIVSDAEPYTYTGTSPVTYKISAPPLRGVAYFLSQNRILYTPLRSFFGEDSYKYRVCDIEGNCSAEKKVTLTVKQGNLPPLINSLSSSTTGVVDETKMLITL